jgi:hypothetical protein
LYKLEFKIDGLPKIITNGSQGSWRAKWANAKKWKDLVYCAIDRKDRPVKPLPKARLILTRISSNQPDFDGLTSSFKPVLDGLKMARIIEDDSPTNIGYPTYRWEKGKRNAGLIQVQVFEVEEVQSEMAL